MEIKLLEMIDSPHVIKFYGCFYKNNLFHVVLEYIEAGSLRDILNNFSVFPESLAQNYTRQVKKIID